MKAEIGLRHSFFCDGVSFKQFSPGYKYALPPPPCSHLIPPPLIFLFSLPYVSDRPFNFKVSPELFQPIF